jgi:glycosyl hydrolase family 42 (putative beta-galactosidase)
MNLLTAAIALLLTAPRPPVADVREHHGAPTLFINGAPHTGLSYMTYVPVGKHFKAMGEAGVHLYSFSATPTESTYNLATPCWVGPDTFDYSGMDERTALLLDNDPEALFFPRIFLGTPPWWADAHPDELVQYDTGDGTTEVLRIRDKRVASWASERWRADTSDAIRRYIRHIESSGYADRVIGYHVASGTTEEWMQWGSNEDQWADYSAPNVNAFRAWLHEKYETDAALQKAWHDSAVTLDTATVPPRTARESTEIGYLRDPTVAQPTIDNVLYTSWLVADTLAYFARDVKATTNDERLVGVFYGYVLQLMGAQREQNAGHLAMREVLSNPDIDFITSPSSYAFRQLGTGFPHAMSLVDSIKLHGKLWFDENDYRTWLTPNVEVGKFGKTATFEETLLAQQREFAWVLTNRLGMWWFDMGGGWYDDPRMPPAFTEMRTIAEACMDADYGSVAEIAYVVDGKSSAYLSTKNPLGWHGIVQQLPALGHIGAPFATIHLADLDRAPEYKLYIFPNCIAPSEEERKLIADRIGARGGHALWIGPAGAYRNGALDPEGPARLTGLPLEVQAATLEWIAEPTDAAAAFGWTGAEPYGPGVKPGVLLAPSEGADLSAFEVIAKVRGSDLPAVIHWSIGPGRGATTVANVPKLPTALLRAIAEKAGVHFYTDPGAIVWSCKDLLAVSVNEGGPTRIRLPRRARIVDLWSSTVISSNSNELEINLAPESTALLRLYPAE